MSAILSRQPRICISGFGYGFLTLFLGSFSKLYSSFLNIYFYWSGCPRSSLQHVGSSLWSLSWGMWDPVPWPGIEPGPLQWKLGVLATGSPGKSWYSFLTCWDFLFSGAGTWHLAFFLFLETLWVSQLVWKALHLGMGRLPSDWPYIFTLSHYLIFPLSSYI